MNARAVRVAKGLAVSLIALCALEGAASWIEFTWDLAVNAQAPLAERRHTTYDEQLGWVNVRSLRAEDLYGPGRSFTSNARGFRGAREVEDAAPAGKVRIVCSGDSFTLGYGVDDASSWPAQLEQLDARIEALNLGQGGYGLDQAYLWYARDAAPLAHDVQVLAFIPDDFERMRASTFLGYGKPRLALEDERLVARNVPVPRASFERPWLTQNRARFFELSTLSLASRAFGRVSAPASERMSDAEAERVATRIFGELARLNAAKHSRLVLVLTPSKDPSAPGRLTRLSGWMQRAVDAARAEGTPWIDLTADFERLDELALEKLFIPRGEIDLPGAAGHYSAAGNRFVAEALHRRLTELGCLRAR